MSPASPSLSLKAESRSDEIAHSLDAWLALEPRRVEVGEGSLLRLSAVFPAIRNEYLRYGRVRQPVPSATLAPALLETQPAAELPLAELREAVERHLLPDALFHDGEVAGRILR